MTLPVAAPIVTAALMVAALAVSGPRGTAPRHARAAWRALLAWRFRLSHQPRHRRPR